MFQKLDQVEERFQEIEQLLADPGTLASPKEMQKLARERREISKLVETYQAYKRVKEEIQQSQELLQESDEEMRDLAKAELQKLKERLGSLEEELKILLLPRDPRDEKNIFLEIRAGTGGEEAALFAASLFRMYSKYAEKKRWRVEVMSENPTGLGGFKEIIALVEGKRVYSVLKHESGVHRVQRVPVTEASGRIHTSAVTVAVLPEADEVELEINPNDLRIDVYRQPAVEVEDVGRFFEIVRAGFSAPRKQLRNALSQALSLSPESASGLLKEAGISPQRRAQTLSLDEWTKLYQIFAEPSAYPVEAR